MRTATLLLVLCCTVCGLDAARAAGADTTKTVLGKHNTDAPINIAADKMTADLNAKSVTYVGNVIVTQADIKMHANSMKVTTGASGKDADKIYADGKVLLDSPNSGTATGDAGIYDVPKKLVTLSGHVILHKAGRATMSGSLLTVNLVTGQAQIVATPVAGTADQAAAPGMPGNRVQGVFTPPSSSGN
jgi:lipopolysaccharide export system protein LptA